MVTHTVRNYYCPHCKHKIRAVTSDDGCPRANLHYTRIQSGGFTGDLASAGFPRESSIEVGMGVACRGFEQMDNDTLSRYRLLPKIEMSRYHNEYDR